MVPRPSQHKKRATLHAAYIQKLKKSKVEVNHTTNSLTVSPDSLSITNDGNKMKNMNGIVRINTNHQTRTREIESHHKGTWECKLYHSSKDNGNRIIHWDSL